MTRQNYNREILLYPNEKNIRKKRFQYQQVCTMIIKAEANLTRVANECPREFAPLEFRAPALSAFQANSVGWGVGERVGISSGQESKSKGVHSISQVSGKFGSPSLTVPTPAQLVSSISP
mmetsp:Transcript_25933/g.53032  ORF Transcript_25933/g.53032 Transcript_25933/m.53032 type:complete len:120 (-) Transcript_25933:1017-1376(-)